MLPLRHVNLITGHLLRLDLYAMVPCVFFCEFISKEKLNMPQSKLQSMAYAGLTVFITVHAFVLYNLYIIEGPTFIALTGAQSTLEAIRAMGGIMIFGHRLPIWGLVLVEFCMAFAMENLVGSPCAFRAASKVFDPRRNHPMLFETAIISATVAIMCPLLSLFAAFMFYPYYEGFNIWVLLGHWFRNVCNNLGFAYFSQLLFIQPLVRRLFKFIFCRQIEEKNKILDKRPEKLKPRTEMEAIQDVYHRMDEIKKGK